MLVLLVGFLYHTHRKKKRNKQFAAGQSPTQNRMGALEVQYAKPTPKAFAIKEHVVLLILKRLDQFESKNGFLMHKLTLARLAKKMKTNPNYLARIIKQHRGKEFNQYINDLRISYLITMLDTNKYRNYTITALANELGFGSTKSFNQAFYKSKGIRYADFIYDLRKNTNTENDTLAHI